MTLKQHVDDTSVGEKPGSVAAWPIIQSPEDAGPGYRYFRVVQIARNSGGNNCLFCGGIELYGRLVETSNS